LRDSRSLDRVDPARVSCTVEGQGCSAVCQPPWAPKIGQGKGSEIINLLINNFITTAFIVGVVVALFFLISGAIGWITSGGDKESLQKSQKKITSALIGLFVLFCLYAIIRLAGDILGINLLKLTLPIISE